MNIYLIGFMGSGKSSVALKMNQMYGMTVVEMDQTLVDREGMSINKIFEEKGEEYFRAKETELLEELSNQDDRVVSCGGGVATRIENIELMKSSGRVILLSATPETIYERVKDNTDRPLLNGHMNVPYIAEMIEKRRPMYMTAADEIIIVDEKTPEEICQEIHDIN